MGNLKVVEARIIDNRIIKDFSTGKNRLQMLEVQLPDGRVYTEFHMDSRKKIEIAVTDTKFDVGKVLKVELDLGYHSREHAYDDLKANIMRIIIPE